MREELIPICITSENFDERFRFMWIHITRNGRLLLCCNRRRFYTTDCHSFCRYVNEVLHIEAFNEFTEPALHYVWTYYRIRKLGSKWYLLNLGIPLFSAFNKESLLRCVKSYFSGKFNRLE